MIKIAPSLLAANFAELGSAVKKLDKAGADIYHLDVMDGHFVPNITFGPALVSSLRPYTKKMFDVHLMVEHPKQWLVPFAGAGADQITVHVETQGIEGTLKQIRTLDKRVGLSIKPGTPVKQLASHLENIDWILAMGVEPGFGGQAFIPETLSRIKEIAEMIKGKKIDLAVDGGMNVETSRLVRETGANVVIAGSAVFKGETYKKNIKALRGA